MTLHCAECEHEWEFTIRLPMELDRAVIVLKGAAAAGCPSCGAHGDHVIVGPRKR